MLTGPRRPNHQSFEPGGFQKAFGDFREAFGAFGRLSEAFGGFQKAFGGFRKASEAFRRLSEGFRRLSGGFPRLSEGFRRLSKPLERKAFGRLSRQEVYEEPLGVLLVILVEFGELFSEVWGPSEPLKSWFSRGRYCIFLRILSFSKRWFSKAMETIGYRTAPAQVSGPRTSGTA